jgi:hypothetical protein
VVMGTVMLICSTAQRSTACPSGNISWANSSPKQRGGGVHPHILSVLTSG